MELTVVIHEERESFWSEVAELPGCFATGRTLSELRVALAEGIGLYLWDLPAVLPDTPLAVGEATIQVTPPVPRRETPA
ncbi:MAG: type II toxin-antitoxin system HicB family antitoxin [Solirubrobacteraceae bacterium]